MLQSETDPAPEVIPTEPLKPTLCLILDETGGQGMIVSQRWHRLYAEALVESDSLILPEVIALAEQAVFVRFLELFVANSETDEADDLRTAIRVLTQLKAGVKTKAYVTGSNRRLISGAPDRDADAVRHGLA